MRAMRLGAGVVAAQIVFSARDRLKVIRIHTLSPLAEVIDLQAFRYRSDEHLVGEPVGSNDATAYGEVPVSVRSSASPNPAAALVLLVNLAPELLRWISTTVVVVNETTRIASLDSPARDIAIPETDIGSASAFAEPRFYSVK